jgi:undecaprenyl-diphosphatase
LLARSVTLAYFGAGLFAVLTVLVQLRVLAEVDLLVARAVAPLGSPVFDPLAEAVAVAVSAEFSVIWSAIASFRLWRLGAGRWSLAPFGFLLLEPIEIVLKLIVHQPPVPHDFYRGVYYPLTTLVLSGTYPSGHAMRSAFLGVFVAVLLGARGGWAARIGPLAVVIVAFFCGFARIYLGNHWLSDVVAGMILGASLAVVVASAVLDRLKPGRV